MAKKKTNAAPTAVDRVNEVLDLDKRLRDMSRYTIDYGKDERFLDLNQKEGYLRGYAYDSRPYDWAGNLVNGFGGGSNIFMPRSDESPASALRQPSTKYLLGRIVINRFVSMLFSERRFPRVSVPKDKDTELYLNKIIRKAKFTSRLIEGATIGGGVGSVIVMFKVITGKFSLECFNPKYCNVLWDSYTESRMKAFCISYPFSQQDFNEKTNTWETNWYLYRRMVTASFDVTFLPELMKSSSNGRYVLVKPNVVPVPDPEKTVFHDLGFVPARFIQNMPRYDQVDGDTSCEGSYELFDRICENLSAVNTALQGNLDPTLVLKMTPDDFRRLEGEGGPIKAGKDGYALVVGATGDAKYIEITCAGLEVAMKLIETQIDFALKTCDCVIADPHKITGAAQSASAIEKLYGPMLAKCDILRTQYGNDGLKELLGLMVQAYHKKIQPYLDDEGLKQGAFEVVEIVDMNGVSREVKPKAGIDSDDIELQWGKYFEPTAADTFQIVESAVMATGGRPVTSVQAAANFLAPYLNDYDVDSTVKDIEDYLQHQETLNIESTPAVPLKLPTARIHSKNPSGS